MVQVFPVNGDIKQDKVLTIWYVLFTYCLNACTISFTDEHNFLVTKHLFNHLFHCIIEKDLLQSDNKACRELCLLCPTLEHKAVTIPAHSDISSVNFLCENPLTVFEILYILASELTLNKFFRAVHISFVRCLNLMVF